MAHITLNYLSKTLGMHQTINVILPEDKSYFDTNENAKPLKTMLLLHGLSSDTSSYMRYTSIERYANTHQLAVVMLMPIIVSIQIWLMDIVIMTIY